MTVFLVKPGERPGPEPEREPSTLLLAVTFGAANPVKYFSKAVKAWDPSKHPKGHKGLFVETPDKKKAKDVKPGDVITTKSGKPFKVEKPTEKGVKVNPLDVVTGEQKPGYTVLGHDIDVAVVESAKGPGSAHQIGQLDLGTIVKTKNGKRFRVAKHGKPSVSKTGQVKAYTTVLPVNDKGEVTGKHTVLPQDHVVTVDAPVVVAHPTVAEIKKVDAAMEEALAEVGKVLGTFGPGYAPVLSGPIQVGDTVSGAASGEPMVVSGEIADAWKVHPPGKPDEWGILSKSVAKKATDPGHVAAMQAHVGKVVSDEDAGADLAGKAEIQAYDPATDAFTLHPIGSADGVTYPESAEELLANYSFEADKAKWPGEYHKSPQGLAQMLVAKGHATTGYENALNDVMKVLESDALALDEDVDGLPKTGNAFLYEYAPIWFGTTQGSMLAANYDDWKAQKKKPDKPKVIDAPGGVNQPEIVYDAVYPVLVNALGFGEHDAAGLLAETIDKGPFKDGAAVVAAMGSKLADETEDMAVIEAVDLAFGLIEAQATPGTIKHVTPPGMHEMADFVAQWHGVETEDVANYFANYSEPAFGGPQLDSPKALQDAWVSYNEYAADSSGLDSEPVPDLSAIQEWWDLNEQVQYEGEPDHHAVALKTLNKAITSIPSQKLVTDAMQTLPDWLAYKADPTLEKLQATTLWTTSEGALPSLGKPPLSQQYQEALALSKAVAHTQVPQQPPPPQEILPQKLPKVPKPYPAGAGEGTGIVIENTNGTLSVWRHGPGGEKLQLVGSAFGSVTEAKKAARAASADHEPITAVETTLAARKIRDDFAANAKIGSEVLRYDGSVATITGWSDEVKQPPSWSNQGPYTRRTYSYVVNKDGGTLQWHMPIIEHADGTVSPHPEHGASGVGLPVLTEQQAADARATLEMGLSKTDLAAVARQRMVDMGYGVEGDKEIVRKARPERYTPYLQQDWDAEQLVGGTVNDALKTLNKLGYREIKPRLKDQVRVIRADGKRLSMTREGTKITGVAESEMPMVGVDGTAVDLHAQLAEALKTGGDLDLLDPRHAPTPMAKTSHVRQMVFDMAKGKQAGVAEALGKSALKVKPDVDYLDEIEAEGNVKGVEDYKALVVRPEYSVTSPRPAAVGYFYEDTDAVIAMAQSAFRTDEDLDEWESAALSAILKRNGVAALVAQPEIPPLGVLIENYRPELKATDPVDGARRLAKEWRGYQEAKDAATANLNAETAAAVKATVVGTMSDETRVYLEKQMGNIKPMADAARQAREDEWTQRAQNLRLSDVQGEVDKRRAVEGTVPSAQAATSAFDVPVWDEIELAPQTYADIDLLTAEIGAGAYDVPAFYTGGALQDGVLYHRADRSNGRVPYHMDALVSDRLLQLGAIKEDNRDPIAPGVGGSYKHYDGEQWTLNDGQAIASEADRLEQALAAVKAVGSAGMAFPTQDAFNTKIAGVQSVQELEQAIDDMAETHLSKVSAMLLRNAIPTSFAGPTSVKRIEYVPHAQASGTQGGAPTSQRGTLRMVGYTPQEAAARLREMGLLGDLEPEVPFEAIMRGPRRYGAVAPLHEAYVRGDAAPPTIKYRITHGLSGQSANDAMGGLSRILESGGLMSIAERHRQGILLGTKGCSVSGDIRSGIDHGVFCTTDGHGAVGSGASVRFVMKPQAYLRRDVVLAPEDFGGCETRYGQYKSYLNKLQGQVGEKRTNLYEPASPAVRQQFIDTATGSHSEEFNIGPGIPLEDIEAIGVPTQADVDKVNLQLDVLISKGRIASKPKVILNGEAKTLANSGVVTAGQTTTAPPGSIGVYKEPTSSLDVGDEIWVQKGSGFKKGVVTIPAASLGGDKVQLKTSTGGFLSVDSDEIAAGKVWY